MASIARATLLRQTFMSASPKSTTLQSLPSLAARTQRSLDHNLLLRPTRIAAFHATSPRAILTPLPQKIEGTVNDPQPVPDPSPMHGSYHWTFERLLTGALVPLTLAPFIGGALNPVLDSLLCASILIHSHIGFQAMIIDYLPVKRMPNIRRLFMWGLNAATVLVGIGLYEFETNDIGLTGAIKKIWTA